MTSHKAEGPICRPITKNDFEAVSNLLGRAYPGRGPKYFLRGLERVAARGEAQNAHGFGLLLEQGGRVTGSLVHIYSERPGFPGPRCNPCCWYVEPAFRKYAIMMTREAQRDTSATYVSVTPARHTWPIFEFRGFTKFCNGGMLAFPLLNASGRGTRVERVLAGQPVPGGLPPGEAQMLREAAALGCLCYVVHRGGTPLPFAFLPLRVRSGRLPLPVAQLAYCRDTADLLACAGELGRALLRRGMVAIWLDADAKIPGLAGWFTARRGRKYYKGPGKPRHNDVLDTELTLFGP